MAVQINVKQFWERSKQLYDRWKSKENLDGSEWRNLSHVVLLVGKSRPENVDNASEMLMNFLLECTLTDTIIVFSKSEITVLASAKKIKILEPVSTSDTRMDGVIMSFIEKDSKDVASSFPKILEKIQSKDKNPINIGYTGKDTLEGKFAPAFLTFMKSKSDVVALVDVTSSMYEFLSYKTSTELELVKKSAQLATRVVKYAFVKRMEDIIDEDLSINHFDLSLEIMKKAKNPASVRSKLPAEACDVFLTPVVQSGTDFDFAPGAEAKKTRINFDTIIFSVGVRFKTYASYIARTLLVGPSKFQESSYLLLVKIYKHIIKELRPGKVLGEIYESATSMISAGVLKDSFIKDCGWEIGKEINKEVAIEKGNNNVVMEGMTFCIRVGFLKSKSGKSECSCLLADTFVVKKNSTVALTKYNFNFTDIMYEIEDSEKDESGGEDPVPVEDVFITGVNKTQRSLRSSKKSKEDIEREKNAANMEKVIRRKQKELILARSKLEMERLVTGVGDSDKEDDMKEIVELFSSTSLYPSQLEANQIYCDPMKECVFIPVYGYHVPFHISTIKTFSKTDEENATLLRFNFFYPTTTGFSKDISPEMKNVIEQHPELAYIKEMTFKAKDPKNLTKQYRILKELQKKVRARRKRREQQADLVEQADLILNQTTKKPRLRDISMKPPLHKGKCVGSLTAHTNGFRFRSFKGESFDLIYSNIKHFIFQPCDHELIVLIHCNLKNPIMVGSKTKTRDVQFYAEAVDGSTALDSHRRTMYDPDEIDEEYRERQLRKRLNRAFKNFCDQVINVVENSNYAIGQNNEYDIPYRNLGFKGVPHKEMVLLQPTVNCLLNVTETPFFVVSLDDIEHIHFERTDFRVSKSFDMVFILKKHMEQDCNTVPQRLQTVPVDKFELIKEWIHEKGSITFTCGTTPLNWKNVMIGVREELEQKIFWSDADHNGDKKAIGWNFLAIDDDESGAEENDAGDDSAFEDNETEPSSEEWSEDEQSSSEEEAESSEDGEDWDELDKRAAASDRKREKREQERDMNRKTTQDRKSRKRRR